MSHTLYVLHASHPCATVERAFELKGVPYRRFELIPPAHALHQKARFGERTVPALRAADGEQVVGSRAILRWVDRLAPEPPLLPADPARRRAVEAAEEWGDVTYQPIGRRVLWAAFSRAPRAMSSYQDGSRLRVPLAALLVAAPVIGAIQRRLNDATDAAANADIAALPGHLERIDAWIGDGVLGGEEPNVADLQIAATTRLLLTVEDLAPVFAGHPAREHALRVFPDYPGRVAAGVLGATRD